MPARGQAYLNGSGGRAVASRPACQKSEQCWRGYQHQGPCSTDADQGCAFPAATSAPTVTNPFPPAAAESGNALQHPSQAPGPPRPKTVAEQQMMARTLQLHYEQVQRANPGGNPGGTPGSYPG